MKEHIKQSALRRLKIVEGQVRGLQKMVEADTYCIDIIRQSSAVKEAVSRIEDLMLEHHLGTHVAEQAKRGQKSKYIREIMEAYKLSKKK